MACVPKKGYLVHNFWHFGGPGTQKRLKCVTSIFQHSLVTVAQPGFSESAPPRHALSLTKVPETLPVPNVMLTECWDIPPLGSTVPSCSIGTALSERDSLYPYLSEKARTLMVTKLKRCRVLARIQHFSRTTL